ncbi:nicotinic acid mononucleotide adenyltransferase [Mariniflexile ostreae]|uniref:Nicotinic acid mononucleotide adenyltransferase n=1 Tax=Mariniflexile ostreae TaxID=1520892 RepID=A0ABV5F6R3_9FLAO
MNTIKLLSSFAFVAMLFTSCYTEVVHDDYVVEPPSISIHQVLNTHELWYVDINATKGYGETPFLQKAFTVSFINGVLYANNNIVGLGDTGNGFGIPVADYDAYNMVLDVRHDVDGFSSFDVFQINNNTLELYDINNDTSYFLKGYQRSNFDYDFVFYDNIHYFLQEYDAWEKIYTSNFGAINEFDNENYLQFLAGGNDSGFRSSQDVNGVHVNNLYWDYTGLYGVGNVTGNMYLKTLTLDYDFFNNEYFELSVINDGKIKLYHPASKTVYEFVGRGYIQFKKSINEKGSKPVIKDKKRKFKKDKVENPRDSSRKI